jgi:hypothetical protein
MKLLHTLIIASMLVSLEVSAQQAMDPDPPGEVLACGTNQFGVINIISGRFTDYSVEGKESSCTTTRLDPGEYVVRCTNGEFILGKVGPDGTRTPVKNVTHKFVVTLSEGNSTPEVSPK